MIQPACSAALTTPQVSTVGKAITDYLPGVRIPEVTNGSAAYRAGFQNNDVIVAVRHGL